MAFWEGLNGILEKMELEGEKENSLLLLRRHQCAMFGIFSAEMVNNATCKNRVLLLPCSRTLRTLN